MAKDTAGSGGDQLFSGHLVEVGGILLPSAFPINRSVPEHVELIRSMQMREDDILVLAFPKSGTHFSWEIASMLLAGNGEHVKRSKVFAMMEATPFEDFDTAPSPRILNTHIPLSLMSPQIQQKKVKVIHIYRNVKDVMVSSFFHFKQFPGSGISALGDIEKPLVQGPMPYGTYIDYLKNMDDYRKKNPEVPFFCMSFEDLKEDPEKMITKMAKFLGVDASPQLVKDIADATNFKKMKEADQSKKHPDKVPRQEIYRRGEVGDWKNYLTVAQSERLDAAMTQLKSCDYHFRYTL